MPHKPRISTRIDDHSLLQLRELSRVLRLSPSAAIRFLIRMGIDSMTDESGYLKADIAARLHVTNVQIKGKRRRKSKPVIHGAGRRRTKRGWDIHLQLHISFEMEYHPPKGDTLTPATKSSYKSHKKTYPEISARCGRLYNELKNVCKDEDVMQDTIIYISADVEALEKDSDNDFITHFQYRYEMIKFRDKKNKQQEAKQNANY